MVAELIDQTIARFPRFARQSIDVQPLEKGGSDRHFYRIRVGDDALILAKYGTQREENRHYVEVARFLGRIGVRVPEIFFHDGEQNLIWMEDLGDRDLWSFREEPWPVRRGLYRGALDQLLLLHTRAHLESAPPPLQTEFDADLYRWEQGYFLENCLGRHFGLAPEAVEKCCEHAMLEGIAERLAALPRVFVHRDFQSQNIVIQDGRACFIDFQGMRYGLVQYDLASLLYDPYVRLSTAERDELLAYYLAGSRELGVLPAQDFREVLDLCAMQRLMQALGAYGFLGLVRGRAHFLTHIPAALENLRLVAGTIAGCAPLAAMLDELRGRASGT